MRSGGDRLPTERAFGLGVGGVCVVAGAASWWRAHDVLGPALLVTGTMLMVSGLAAPGLLRVPNRIWWLFAQALGWINTRILLTAFFVAVLTPVGILMRLLGRGPLRASPSATTWLRYRAGRRDSRHYQRMF